MGWPAGVWGYDFVVVFSFPEKLSCKQGDEPPFRLCENPVWGDRLFPQQLALALGYNIKKKYKQRDAIFGKNPVNVH